MGRPSRYPEQFRHEAVQMALASDESRASVARRLGVNETTLRNWVANELAEQARQANPLSGLAGTKLIRFLPCKTTIEPARSAWTSPVIKIRVRFRAMTDGEAARPPAEWYLDPDDSKYLRWFDGTKWGEFRKPADVPRASAAPTASGQMPSVVPPSETPAPLDTSRAEQWEAAVLRWRQVIEQLPETSTAKQGMFSSHPKGYAPNQLIGRDLLSAATGWGRPDWWTPEPATGGAVVGWISKPNVAVHVAANEVCDKLLTKTSMELDVSWGLRRLCNVLGRPTKQVETFLGLPTARSGAAGGGELLQWQRTGYHVALRFDADGYCLGITHQFMHNPQSV